MNEIYKAIEHFERLQKRYTTTHNGKHCELVKTAIAALRAEQERQWISVEDKLPKESLNVLIYIPFRGAHLHYVSYMESGLWYVPTMYGRSSLDDVTHWMPLPAPPEKQSIKGGTP